MVTIKDPENMSRNFSIFIFRLLVELLEFSFYEGLLNFTILTKKGGQGYTTPISEITPTRAFAFDKSSPASDTATRIVRDAIMEKHFEGREHSNGQKV